MSSCQKNVPHFFGKLTNFSYLIFLGNPPIFPNSFVWKPNNFSYLIFLGNPPIFPASFFGKPTNFSYLFFLENPPIFSTSFSWETHQFFLPHFLGKLIYFSYLIFLGNPPIWLMKLSKTLHLMRFLATISVIIWNFCKLLTMKEGTIDTYKTTSPLLSYLIRVLRNLSLKI